MRRPSLVDRSLVAKDGSPAAMHGPLASATIPLIALSLSCTPADPAADVRGDAGQDAYHILVTNDDGIASPGVQALAEALREVGEVTLVAPCGQMSGSSMSVRLGQQKRLVAAGGGDGDGDAASDRDGEPAGRCVDGTPADAAMVALEALAPEGGFDLVVSGINAGANTGDFAHMSGTIGAAMMGAYYGVPAVAASLGGPQMDFAYPAAFVARFVERLRRRPPRPGVVLSVNFPAATESAISGVTVARAGGSYVDFGYEEAEPDGDARVFRPVRRPAEAHPPGSDTEAFVGGMITIAPLRFDWTDEDVLREMATWELDHRVGREGN